MGPMLLRLPGAADLLQRLRRRQLDGPVHVVAARLDERPEVEVGLPLRSRAHDLLARGRPLGPLEQPRAGSGAGRSGRCAAVPGSASGELRKGARLGAKGAGASAPSAGAGCRGDPGAARGAAGGARARASSPLFSTQSILLEKSLSWPPTAPSSSLFKLPRAL